MLSYPTKLQLNNLFYFDIISCVNNLFIWLYSYFSFTCKSADYNIVTLSCALSSESRRTQGGSYISGRDTEYLENSCVPSEQLTCPYKRTDNAYPRYLDTIVTRVTDEIACERQCTFFEEFPCRSFAFYTSASQCFISGDDQVMVLLSTISIRWTLMCLLVLHFRNYMSICLCLFVKLGA